MSTTTIIEKYSDIGIPIVTIFIINFSISNTLIYLGVAINVIKMETMQHLK